VYDGKLVAGGTFTYAGGRPALCIAQWDGSTWSPMGSGINGSVAALAVYNGTLVAGGFFTTAGGNSVGYIASWNGSAWSPLGAGMDNSVSDLTLFGGDLIAGGYFYYSGGTFTRSIAVWNGSSWSPLGSGMNGPVNALTVYDGALIAGGSFSTAGGNPASHIAQWSEPAAVDGNPERVAFTPQVYPNPCSGACRISFRLPSAGPVTVDIADVGGRMVRHLLAASHVAGDYSLVWDGRDDSGRLLSPGVYLTRVQTSAGLHTGRVVRIQ
jgi:hypothetical protein